MHDIPKPGLTSTTNDTVLAQPEPTVSSANSVARLDSIVTEFESVGLRCSNREKRPPQKFTGEPLTLVFSLYFPKIGFFILQRRVFTFIMPQLATCA